MLARLLEIVGLLTALVLIVKTVSDMAHSWRESRRRRRTMTILVLALALPSVASAQLWATVLDSSRATDWTRAGVTGGIPSPTHYCYGPGGSRGGTIAAYGTSGAPLSSEMIALAIRDCHVSDGGGIVQLGAGTFYLSDSLGWTVGDGDSGVHSVVLRGMGPDQTTLVFKGQGGTYHNCSTQGLVCMGDYHSNSGVCAAVDRGSDGEDHARRTWTAASYGAGQTVITVSSTAYNGTYPSGFGQPIQVGMYVLLTQANPPDSGGGDEFSTYRPFPNSNNSTYSHLTCQSDPFTNHCIFEWHKVIAINGNDITITPPLQYTDWRSALTPEVWWCTRASQTAIGNGIENLFIDNQTGIDDTGAVRTVINFANAFESWVKNVKIKIGLGAYVNMHGAGNIEVRDSYFYSNPHPQHCATPNGTTTYGIDPIEANMVKVENNIFHQVCKPLMAQSCVNCVFGYNYMVGNLLQVQYSGATPVSASVNPSVAPNHVASSHLNLFEGNDGSGFIIDHQTGHGAGVGLITAFRNRFQGYQANDPLGIWSGTITYATPVFVGSLDRFVSIVGNVLGDPSISSWTYELKATVKDKTTPNQGGTNYMYGIGWAANSNTAAGDFNYTGYDDPLTGDSLMRWGNYDYVTGAIRWCGNSSNTGWVAVCASTTEIPAGSGSFTQFVPSTETLPPSFYLNGKPSWFGNVSWPAIGPDVTTGYDTSTHAGSIPARQCYLNVMHGPTDGSGSVLTFNADNCYGSSATPGQISGKGRGKHLKHFIEWAPLVVGMGWHFRRALLAGCLALANLTTLSYHATRTVLPEAAQKATYTSKVLAAKAIQAMLPRSK